MEEVAARLQARLAETVARYETDIILLQMKHEEELKAAKGEVVSGE